MTGDLFDSLDQPRVFSIPAGAPFLNQLARTLLLDRGFGGKWPACETFDLADFTILLPTRRAVRSLGEAFLRESGGNALILPDIRPLGDMDEEEMALDAGADGRGGYSLDLLPAIDPFERLVLLTRLILQAWPAMDVARGFSLARELAGLLDQVATEEASLDRLHELVPETFAENWQETVAFLTIITENWPAILAERGLMDVGERRIKLLRMQAELWRDHPPKGPVIVAGSTGSIPASADMMLEIANLPLGAVVLPGLDMDLDRESFAGLPPSHPQYGLGQLLNRFGLHRRDVLAWPETAPAYASTPERRRLVSEVMRPAETTDRWQARLRELKVEAGTAFEGLHLLEAENERVEAASIALAMRETLEHPNRAAALITPDRALARRVASELSRWHISVDDSAGTPLSLTSSGSYLRLAAEAVAEGLAPVPLLALLKHPLTALGSEPGTAQRTVRRLERFLLRGLKPAPGFAGLRARMEEHETRAAKEDASIRELIDRLETAFQPLLDAFDATSPSLSEVLRGHILTAEALAATDATPMSGAERLWQGEAGEALSAHLAQMLAGGETLTGLKARTYPHLITELFAGKVIRPRFGRHPRLSILGPLEARLLHTDLIILGGLNEGIWPMETSIDPWLNRPMRKQIGLESPERRIGLSAHDFAQSLAHAPVLLTRALKSEGSPTVASRWLLRLINTADALGRIEALRETAYADWVPSLDKPEYVESVDQPRPCPPVPARPTSFSVTEIETLVRDPYGIYAKKVLNLKPLDPLAAEIGARERGTLIHKILEQFTLQHKDRWPDDPERSLIDFGRELFRPFMDIAGVASFWWPRFLDVARFFIDWEEERRPRIDQVFVEVSGTYWFDRLPAPVELRARADRIERLTEGGLALIDFKTGELRSKNQVAAGLAPQLPLEAAIAARGGFAHVPAEPAAELIYVQLKGGETPAKVSEVGAGKAADLAETALSRLEQLLAGYQKESTAYLSRPRPKFVTYAGDYDHLARVKEWAAQGDEGEGGEP